MGKVSLSKLRRREQGVADLLNYGAMIEPGVVLNKDGSLMCAFSYLGRDLDTAGNGERNQVTGVVNAALNALGSGWMLHVDAVRNLAQDYVSAGDCYFPDPVSRMIDQERREQFTGNQYYVTEYMLVLTWLPPMLTQSRLVSLLIDSGAKQKKPVSEGLVEQFQQAASAFAGRVNTVIAIERLEGDAFLTWLSRCITGSVHPVLVPVVPMYLDAVLSGSECWTGLIPQFGNHFVQVVSIEGFPSESEPQILQRLADLGIPYRWSTRFIFQDEREAKGWMDKFRRGWLQQARGFISQVFGTSGGKVNLDALDMVSSIDAASADASAGHVKFGFYTAVVVLRGVDIEQLKEVSQQVLRIINRLGFTGRVESVNTMEALLGSLPGHGYYNVRKPLLHTLNLADLLPLSAVWAGRAEAPCHWLAERGQEKAAPALMQVATGGYTPFRFNLHVGDLGHTLMIGPTGAGKSTVLALIAVQFLRYKNANVFAFDKGNSLLPMTLATGGQHFNISGSGTEEELYFAPLSRLGEQGWFGMLEDWCNTLFVLQGLTLSPVQRNELHRALVVLAKSEGEKTLSTLQMALQDIAMREALEAYTMAGETGLLLDSAEDGLSFSHWSCFEIGELMNRNDRIKLPVLLYLFMAIEKRLTGQPTLLILDEAWLMLGHEVFKQKLREWLKVLRKANCSVVLATQSLSDAAHSGILDVLTESCPTKIFLSNADAESELNKPLYQSMGVSGAEIEKIAGLIPKRHYFIKGEGKRVIDFNIGEVALAFCGNSDPEALAVIRELWDNDKENFSYNWLKYLGVEYEPYL